MNKEHNFVSAIVYLDQAAEQALGFLQLLDAELDSHFIQYEIIAVVPSKDYDGTAIREWASAAEHPVTLLVMSLTQRHEQCMNAGLDIAIGDYVYEFDSTEMPYQSNLIWAAYESALQGNDIVSVCPGKGRSKLFYALFNKHSNAAYAIRTDIFRLVSRRAINRVYSMNDTPAYRKAAYAACGLKMHFIVFDGSVSTRRKDPFALAVDSLVLYTDFGYKFGIGLALLMLAATLAELAYTIVVWLAGNPVSGWSTTMFVITLSMTGLFALLAVVLKYLTLLIRIAFNKQGYLIESIEKV